MVVPASLGLTAPTALRPGDSIRIVAPASPCEERLAWRALGWLATRYPLRFDRRIFERAGYLAGDDAARRAELQRALDEPDVGAVLCTRGGYGLSRFAHQLDWGGFRARPRWIMGFSDVTALHVELGNLGFQSVHGPNLTAYGRADPAARQALVDVLERPQRPRHWTALRTILPGEATGPLSGGNLSLLHACAAAGRLHLPDGAVLLLEEVAESPYRLDRMLTTLLVGGHLRSVGAVVLGEFERCTAVSGGPSAEQVLAERLASLGVPVVAGMPVGHGDRNQPVVLGASARLVADGATATLTLGPGAPRAADLGG